MCCPKNTCKAVTVLLLDFLCNQNKQVATNQTSLDHIFTLQKVQGKGGGHQSPSPHGLKTHCASPESSKLLSCIHPPI